MNYLINFILLGLVYVLHFYKKWSRKNKKVLIINTLMYIYVVMVLFVTLMPFTIPFGIGNYLFMVTANFIPFRDLKLNYHGAVREIFLNIIMMIPFGFLYPIIKKKGILKTVIMTFFFSLIIECAQLMSAMGGGPNARAFDVTDLITNTFGGLVGYFFFVTLEPVILKILKE
ncbi:VanZ family protein [Anaerosacchariphilus polymeriproducens]|uniref:VanZ family protein n=1 Tax=Anaerosacchariphilus polymeriproducens TaxID=1812858 RepID=A0A371AVB5_9FIRM|nr:VanZ family protein [Anaerosacchariphilus polymeriproducens]RDU23525.1 VanZ family protein [Anaerosacchariphilus polymeriproducens]